MALNLALEMDEFLSEWKVFDLNAFIEGDWIKDFKTLENKLKLIEGNGKEKKEKIQRK
jgi:hypothetical protein